MSYRQSRIDVRSVSATVISTVFAALIAGAALAGVLYDIGLLGAIAGLYGVDGYVSDLAVVFAHSFAASALFVAVLGAIARGRYTPTPLVEASRSAFLGACVGAAYGILLWIGVVAYGIPLWYDFVGGPAYPMPYRHLESFLALLSFGVVLGVWYPLIRTTFERVT